MLSYGIESTSPGSLAEIDKEWNRPERYAQAVATIRAHRHRRVDGDDYRIRSRRRGCLRSHLRVSDGESHLGSSCAQSLPPFQAPPLYDEMERQGRMSSDDFGRFSGGHVVFQPRNFEPAELQANYWNLYERLFEWKSILHRIGRNSASLDSYMRMVVLGINLHYRNHIRRRICPGIV
jgi:hypothetical protein